MKSLLICLIIITLSTFLFFSKIFTANHRLYKNKPQQNSELFYYPADTIFYIPANAFEYIKKHNEKYNIPNNSIKDLKLREVKHSLTGKHYIYQQVIDDIPIEKAEIVISIDNNGKIIKIFHNLHEFKYISKGNKLNYDAALDIAWNHLYVHGKLMSLPATDLKFIQCGDSLLLCYKIYIDTEGPWGN